MFASHNRNILVGSLVLITGLLTGAVGIGYYQVSQVINQSEHLIGLQNHKSNLLISMHAAVEGRYTTLLEAAGIKDPFARDKRLQYFRSLAGRYIKNREALSRLLASPQEWAFYKEQKRLAQTAAPLMQQAADLLAFNENPGESLAMLLGKAIPAQEKMLQLINKMSHAQINVVQQAVARSRVQRNQAFMWSGMLLLLAVVTGICIVFIVNRRLSRANNMLYARVTLDSIEDAVISTDVSGLVNYMNQQAQALLDKSLTEVLGRPLEAIMHYTEHDDGGTLKESDSSTPVSQHQEYLLQTNEQTAIPIECSVSPIIDGYHTLGQVVIFRNISVRKAIEKTLQDDRERFALIVRGTSDGIWDYNLQTGTLYLSPRWKAMLEYSDDEFDGGFLQWQEHIHPDSLGHILEVWTHCMDGHSQSFTIEYRMKTRKGQWRWVESRGIALQNREGEPVRLAGSHTDITARRELEDHLKWRSTHDQLTDLSNRYELEERLKYALESTCHFSCDHALLYIDIDQFKVINDTCGHLAGDELLRQIAALLRMSVRGSDALARLGGDEFGLLLQDCPVGKIKNVAKSLCEAIQNHPFVWDSQRFHISASIGAVAINAANATSKEVFSAADLACYTAKDLGGNRFCLYQESDEQMGNRHREMSWVSRINEAIQENRFVLYCQPIVPIAAGAPHQEILVRMLDSDGKLVPPGLFIPSAERYNLMPAIDRWVISTLLGELAQHSEPGMVTSVNLSGTTFNHPEFLDFIRDELARSGVDPTTLCFEITETAAISNLSHATTFIEEMKKIGCLFSLDDFGTGLSSFEYLKNLPVDYLKIDGQFVKDIVDDPIDDAMVRAINNVGHVMGMQTIAEFVENQEILAVLTDIGVDYAQGYGLGKPQPFCKPSSESVDDSDRSSRSIAQ